MNIYVRINRNTPANFNRSRARLLHVSAIAKMVNNPLAILAAKTGAPFVGNRLIEYVQKPGITYNFGHNAAKRAAKIQRGVTWVPA